MADYSEDAFKCDECGAYGNLHHEDLCKTGQKIAEDARKRAMEKKLKMDEKNEEIERFRQIIDDEYLIDLARQIYVAKEEVRRLYNEIDDEWDSAMTIIRERNLTLKYLDR